VIFWLAPIAVGTAIGRGKHRAGWAWGLLLGWLGVIILVILPPGKALTLERLDELKDKDIISKRQYEQKRAEVIRQYEEKRSEPLAARTHRECPHCKEPMRRDASVCPHCQRDSQPWTLNEGFWWKPADDGSWLYLDEQSGEWKSPVATP